MGEPEKESLWEVGIDCNNPPFTTNPICENTKVFSNKPISKSVIEVLFISGFKLMLFNLKLISVFIKGLTVLPKDCFKKRNKYYCINIQSFYYA